MENINTDKKKQHYVPKFYLRNFSNESSKKNIGVFNIKKSLYIKSASLKNQAYNDFFYGKDGLLEEHFCKLESNWAIHVQNIIADQQIKSFESEQYKAIIEFIINLEFRNPLVIYNLEVLTKNMGVENGAINDFDVNKERPFPDTINSIIKKVGQGADMIYDLGFKLIRNFSNSPFITSDYPVIKYNQFHEFDELPSTGLACTGLQIFFPIDPNIMLVLYDKTTYSVGSKFSNIVITRNESDVDQLNSLQILNCDQNVFFSTETEEKYLNDLLIYSKKYSKTEENKITTIKLADTKDATNSRYVIGETSAIKQNLHLSFCSFLIKRQFARSNPWLRERPAFLRQTKYAMNRA